MSCDGNGNCLRQLNENEYYADPDVKCEYNCKSFECSNYILCKTTNPKWLLDCHGGLCLHCDMMFGKWCDGKGILNIINNVECPICYELTTCLSQPKCDHYICISCFKRCYYGDKNNDNEPMFPYPDIENEYYADPENIKWKNNYPLIDIYNNICDELDEEYELKRSLEEIYLAKCPICRK